MRSIQNVQRLLLHSEKKPKGHDIDPVFCFAFTQHTHIKTLHRQHSILLARYKKHDSRRVVAIPWGKGLHHYTSTQKKYFSCDHKTNTARSFFSFVHVFLRLTAKSIFHVLKLCMRQYCAILKHLSFSCRFLSKSWLMSKPRFEPRALKLPAKLLRCCAKLVELLLPYNVNGHQIFYGKWEKLPGLET